MAGCAGLNSPDLQTLDREAENGPTDSAWIPGYHEEMDDFTDLDTSSLHGRRILLDPGHGGHFRGALGPAGLTEAEVNLGVAHYLRGMLEWAGASVHMTRTADIDFLTPADSTLSHDLAFRVSLADSLQPDVFISIHHNSTASQDPDINETQTYYPLGDDGASLDLARSIHRQLVRKLGIRPAKILPGNFHVLRHSPVPSVLGEPAMLSNPVMEGRLSLAASHELEAQAYFLGLLDYFRLGRPRWSASCGDTVTCGPRGPSGGISFHFVADSAPDPSAPGPDPSTFSVLLNGHPQGFDLSPDGRTLNWSPRMDLPHGSHRLEVRGGNLRGRATPVAVVTLDVGEGTTLLLDILQEGGPRGQQLLSWRTSRGVPADEGFLIGNRGTRLAIPPRTEGQFLLGPDVGDTAWKYQLRDEDTAVRAVIDSRGSLADGRELKLLTLGEEPVFAASRIPGTGWRRRLPAEFPRAGGSALVYQPGQEIWIEGRGVLPVVLPGDRRTGTMPPTSDLWRPTLLVPELFGRTIVLDPAGGGTVDEGRFPMGDRGSDWNLSTAIHLKALLEGAGAQVVLTRDGEIAPDARGKVLLEREHGAELFLTIGRVSSGDPPVVQHHPGSVLGERGARAVVQAFGALENLARGESYAYLLRHTSCPALEVRLPSPADAYEERWRGDRAYQLTQARALLLACAAVFGNDGTLPANLPPEQILAALPQRALSSGDGGIQNLSLAVWDGNFPWYPGRPDAGQSTWAGRNPNPTKTSHDEPGWPATGAIHTLEIHRQGNWQLWRVEITPRGYEMELILENR